jgi:hypothetical protein
VNRSGRRAIQQGRAALIDGRICVGPALENADMERRRLEGAIPPRAFGTNYNFGSPRVALLDTDYILNRVAAAPARFQMLDSFPGLRLRAVASKHVLDELYSPDNHGYRHKWDKLAEQAAERGAPVAPGVFRDTFESRYLERITFVEAGGLFANDPYVEHVRRRRNGRGASDAPTAQVAVLLSRLQPIVYSHDEHLWKPGLAPRPRAI